jgi:putative DNA primase/helicase
MNDKAEADNFVAKTKADFAVELQRRREAEAGNKPPIELVQRLANPEKPKRDYLKLASDTGTTGDKPKGEKPEIELGPKDSAQLGEAVVNAMMWLASNRAKIYQRGGKLMRPVAEPSFDAEGNPVKVSSLIEMDEAALKLILMRDLTWVRKNKEGKRRHVNPGFEIPRLILKARGVWPFPAVSGLINAPTLRPDGSLLFKEGYDNKTGLLLLNAPSVPIKLHPTRADAEAALETLKALLVETPFVKDVDRAVALSLILTIILRGTLETSPLHIFVSPIAGSGKSYIVDIANLIATGRRCAVLAATKSSEELEKRLGAAMLSGRPLISLDNLNGELSSNLLCQAVSQPVVSFRPLGASAEISVTTRSVFAATGNNLSIADDLGRRTLQANIDANTERPWERQFKQKPLEMIARDRAKFIAAALTIPLAFIAAQLPDEPPELNGFAQWSRLVRAPLMWLGEDDPVLTMEAAREGDAKLQAKGAALAAIADLFGLGEDRARTAAQMIDATDPFGNAVGLKEILGTPFKPEAKQRVLREALMAVAGAGKEIAPAKLGYWLRQGKGQIVGGRRLCGKQDKHAKVMRWWVETGFAGDAGDCG